MKNEKSVPLTKEERDAQIKKEVKATAILFIICAVWHVGFGYLLTGTGLRIAGLPLWWLISVPGVFVVAVVGVVYLLRNVFVNFDLGGEEGENE